MDPGNHFSAQNPDQSRFDSPREMAVIPAVVGGDRAPYCPTGSSYGPEGPDPAESEGGLLDYWRTLGRHKTAIILSSLAGLLIGFGIGIPMKPVYRTRTSIEVLSLNENFMNSKQTNPVTTDDSSDETSEEETQSKLLQSNSLMTRVLDKLDPGHRTAVKPKMAATGWRHWLHLSEKAEPTPRRRLLNGLTGSLNVRSIAHTRLIEVTADSTNQLLAADFLNTLVEEFIQQNLEARFAATHRTSDWLTREIDDARENLKKSEDALQAYARNSGLIFTDETTNVATEKLEQFQQQLSAATANRIAKQARFELAKDSPPDTLADVMHDDSLTDISTRRNELRQKVADLSAIYTPEFSQVRRTQAELAVVEAAFDVKRADIMKSIENDYHEAADKEKLLAEAYDGQAREVTGQDEKAIQYNILKREVDSSRQLYDTMLQQTKQSSIASALRASNVRVVDPAGTSGELIFPKFPLNSGIGLIAGLFLCIALVTIREQADRTLQQPGDIRMRTELIELGTIPSLVIKRIYGRAWVTTPDTSLSGNGRSSVELITWQQKPSIIAESFRSTLTSILFIGENGSRPRVLVFTSAQPEDGKTTVVSNLAIATAEIRRKVLVIDADLRRPRLHEVFGLSNDRGLSDILREELSEENVAGLIQKTGIPNLDVLTAGKATHAAAHLLYSNNFAPLLATLKKKYDMILIDTPPMLQMTDARVAGRLADAVILVARAGVTTRDSILAAKERLGGDSIRVLGTVLNAWNPKKAPGGYYGSYRQGYYGKYDTSK